MIIRWGPENIIEENDQFLVVYKPAGLAVQSGRASQTDLEHLLLNYLADRRGDARASSPRIFVIHRLDQPVEGIMVFAKTAGAAAALSSQIQKQQITKEYVAVVGGIPNEREGRLTDWLRKDGKTNAARVVRPDVPGAKKAVLEYRCLEKLPEGRALLGIRLLTGRHHQIRAQMAHAGWPLLGDQKYNPKADANKKDFPALCAFRLTFRHPRTGKRVSYQTEPKGQWFRECKFFLNGFLNSEEKLPESID